MLQFNCNVCNRKNSNEIMLSYMCKRKRLRAGTLNLLSLQVVVCCNVSSQSRKIVPHIKLESVVCISSHVDIQINIK